MRIENPIWNETFRENLPKWIHIWIMSFILIGSILFGLNNLLNFANKDNTFIKVFSIITIMGSILLLFNRDIYLPFLGENFLPNIFLNLKKRTPKNVEKKIKIQVEPNTTVLYWAADPGKDVKKDWKKGYGKFENSGVLSSDKHGNAEIPIICPSRYIVHGYKILPKHLHYRTYNKDTQMLSRIKMIVLKNECK